MKINFLIQKMNEFGRNNLPFFFIINFDLTEALVFSFNETIENQILFNIDGIKNYNEKNLNLRPEIKKYPESIDKYKLKFNKIIKELHHGNSYLINLTCKTRIELNLNLEEIFYISKANYKVYFPNKFVCFSPECFVKTHNNFIYTYPMKGTILNENENSLSLIINDFKEEAEHNTIVDLLRNDLSIVSENVKVNKFRFPTFIKSTNTEIIQISSEICGQLPSDWNHNIGDIIFKLLPAGSVTGAPKKETIRIIKEVEDFERKFYTGIFGYFNGKELNSAVSIRFIEYDNFNYYFKSGGGITINSILESEYNEMLNKIYVPIH